MLECINHFSTKIHLYSICSGHLKGLSLRNGYFEHPKHMFKPMNKKILYAQKVYLSGLYIEAAAK